MLVLKVLMEPNVFQRVLTTEFIHGVKISDVADLEKQNFSLADVSRKLVDVFSEQIFHTGFVHADPHPGNSNAKFPRYSMSSTYTLPKLGCSLDPAR